MQYLYQSCTHKRYNFEYLIKQIVCLQMQKGCVLQHKNALGLNLPKNTYEVSHISMILLLYDGNMMIMMMMTMTMVVVVVVVWMVEWQQ